tara:strand:- start:3509 stop:5029 length:1521 start_codon:yes stop_codon:yes gene_type:complete
LKTALISVWNKDNVVELAKFLINEEFKIISTGGTKKILIENDIKVTSISEITNFNEIMNGRVKTLHPKIFGGLLADRSNEQHLKDLESINSSFIDLVVVNLYPFEEMASKKNSNLNKLIDYIDVGGPSMLRAAAKNYKSVITLSNPSMYEDFMIEYSKSKGMISPKKRKEYAKNVFLETSKYDSIIFNEFSKNDKEIPDSLNINLSKNFDLRYGENPHQFASFYNDKTTSSFKQLSGKKLSYNNFFDIETSIRIVNDFKESCCCIIKHSNPCGFALGQNLIDCFETAVSCDSVSYFGGIVGFNRKINSKIAKKLIEPFLECIVCPDIDEHALEILKMKKNLRVIIYNKNYNFSNISVRSVMGGFLSQTLSNNDNLKDWKIVTKKQPISINLDALKLGWKIVKYVKSNAIVIANQKQILGVGAGQMSRVDSVKIAIQKSIENGFDLKKSILASDAFFPFSDSIELASKHGIKHFIQPGGSIKDQEIIKMADKLKVSMIFTGQRLFFH